MFQPVLVVTAKQHSITILKTRSTAKHCSSFAGPRCRTVSQCQPHFRFAMFIGQSQRDSEVRSPANMDQPVCRTTRFNCDSKDLRDRASAPSYRKGSRYDSKEMQTTISAKVFQAEESSSFRQ